MYSDIHNGKVKQRHQVGGSLRDEGDHGNRPILRLNMDAAWYADLYRNRMDSKGGHIISAESASFRRFRIF